ncbi:MAG: hypothetical protein KJ957_07090 [Candidatus Omnitrophica bacterium]|nr:hypothetical protein [Candidatus Omnitrophota bacterium]MBU1853789.1 hypothetical protein [Candidatus Omnitrophota bacterium]
MIRLYSQTIEEIKKRHRQEWLLISVDKVDESTTTPISGRLIAHSPQRDEIYKKLLVFKRRKPVLISYSEDTAPGNFITGF